MGEGFLQRVQKSLRKGLLRRIPSHPSSVQVHFPPSTTERSAILTVFPSKSASQLHSYLVLFSGVVQVRSGLPILQRSSEWPTVRIQVGVIVIRYHRSANVKLFVHRTVNECELCTSQGLERCRSLFYIDVWQYVRINVQKKSLAMQARDRKYYGGKID